MLRCTYALITLQVVSFCVRFDSFVGYLDIFSGLFRFSRIYSNYIGDSAETVALAITSIRCRDIAQACYYFIMPADCWSLIMGEMYALWRIAAYFYRVIWFWPTGSFGAQAKLVDFSTRDVSFRLARNVLDTGYRCYWLR